MRKIIRLADKVWQRSYRLAIRWYRKLRKAGTTAISKEKSIRFGSHPLWYIAFLNSQSGQACRAPPQRVAAKANT